MSWPNTPAYEPSEDTVLVAALQWKKWTSEAWSDADMNNWVSVEWWFLHSPPTVALIDASIKDFTKNILWISDWSK